MMLQFNEDGTVSKVDEEELVYVNKNELDKIAEEYNKLVEENEQLQKQIKVYEYFLDQNNLDIDWNCLCTADECIFSAEEIDEKEINCKDCKCMELKE